MPQRSPTYRRIWTAAGIIAAVALAVRGLLDLRSGGGAPLLLVAVAVLAAIYMRHSSFKD